MIVHVVLVRPRPDLSESEQSELSDAVRGLAEVTGVQDFTWGPDFSGRGKGYTHAAVMRFVDRDALQAYQDDPEHKRIVQVFNRVAPDRLIVDYETPE